MDVPCRCTIGEKENIRIQDFGKREAGGRACARGMQSPRQQRQDSDYRKYSRCFIETISVADNRLPPHLHLPRQHRIQHNRCQPGRGHRRTQQILYDLRHLPQQSIDICCTQAKTKGYGHNQHRAPVHLDLSENALDDTHAAGHIGALITHNPSLVSLRLRGNLLKAEGGRAALDALASNRVLRDLDLGANPMVSWGAQATSLARMLQENTTLTALGVTPPAKGLPDKLTSFTIQKDVIDAESELVEEPAQLFPPRDA